MSAPFVISALWLLSMLAALACAAAGPRQGFGWAWIAPTFAVVLFATRYARPDPSWVGAAIALTAAWLLLGNPGHQVRMALAGALSALAAALYIGQGVSTLVVAPACLAAIFAAAIFARAASPNSAKLFGKGLVALALLGPILAAAPGVLAGWHAARALNQAADAAAAPPIQQWAWQFAAAALLLGLLHGLWARR